VDDLQSEKEQIEEMRQWWKDNGAYVIGGIVIGASLLFGWNYHKSSQLAEQEAASELFETLAVGVGAGDLDDAALVADQLSLDHADSAYTAQSKLAMASLYMEKNRDQDAADVLGQLLAMSGNEELKGVARLRLAKIMLYQDRPQDVIDMLGDQDGSAFSAAYADVIGDAHAAMGDYAAAEQAYQLVLADAGQGSVDRAVVQMKLLDLPDATEVQTAIPPEDAATTETAAETAPDADADTDTEAEDVE
jgi:predicted negative regulator of RcsB-dependent stress response